MRIQTVSYCNLKGRSESVDLGPATLIHGPNFAGKTTIVDAIKLALLGFMPGLDRTGRGVMELASSDELSVSARIRGMMRSKAHPDRDPEECEFMVGRTWTRRGERVEKKDFVPMGWPEVPVVLLDANAYFGASDRGKAELLFSAANIKTAITVPEVRKVLQAFGVDVAYVEGAGIQNYVQLALEVVEKHRSDAAASARRYADTMQGLSALRPDPVPLDEKAAELRSKKSGELADALEKLHALERNPPKVEPETTDQVADEKLETARRREKTLAEFIVQKDIEVGKCINRWDGLLKHEDCPTCGTKGDAWRSTAIKNKQEEMAALEAEKFQLKRERNNVLEFIAVEEKRQGAERANVEKKNKAAVAKAHRAWVRKLEAAEEKVAELREELADAERSVKDYIEDQADRKRLAEAKAKHGEHAAREKNMKEAKAYLLQLKAQMASDLFGSIIKTARMFTDGILKWPLVFWQGELGMWQGGKPDVDMSELASIAFVPHRAFSGTEQAVAFAGFQAALGATAPVRLVVMDELGRIDKRNKAALLSNVYDAIEGGVIDQFVGIDTEPTSKTGFTLIERGGKKKA